MQLDIQSSALILVHHGGRFTPEVINGYTSLKNGIIYHFYQRNKPLTIYDAFLNSRYTDSIDGVVILDLECLLQQLVNKNIKQLFIQPSLLVPGQQYTKLINLLDIWQDKFDKIIIGDALLSDLDSCQKLAGMVDSYFGQNYGVENILIAHGGANIGNQWLNVFINELQKVNPQFNMLELSRGESPELFSQLLQLEIDKLATSRSIKIISFMLILGHHFYNDIVTTCNSIKSSLNIEVFPQSLSELEFIHQFIAEKIEKLVGIK